METPSHAEFDASERGEVSSQLVRRIERLPETLRACRLCEVTQQRSSPFLAISVV